MIETERLLIAPLRPEGREAMLALWLDPANERIGVTDGEEQVRSWVAGAWGVWERDTGELVGDCSLFRNDDGAWELAYGFRRDRWGRGYATEAARACVEHGFAVLDLTRIVADVAATHAPSIRVLEKCGFERVGEENGKLLYAVTR